MEWVARKKVKKNWRKERRRYKRYRNPQFVAQHCFVASFGLMFHVFHLMRWTCQATKTFVSGWRKLLWEVERASALSNKFWLCCCLFWLCFHQTHNLSHSKFAHVVLQVEGFCILCFAAFSKSWIFKQRSQRLSEFNVNSIGHTNMYYLWQGL